MQKEGKESEVLEMLAKWELKGPMLKAIGSWKRAFKEIVLSIFEAMIIEPNKNDY